MITVGEYYPAILSDTSPNTVTADITHGARHLGILQHPFCYLCY